MIQHLLLVTVLLGSSALIAAHQGNGTAPVAGNITFVITPQNNMNVQCHPGRGVFKARDMQFTVQSYYNGLGPAPPRTQTGLPVIDMSWFVDGAPAANAHLGQKWGINDAGENANVVSFKLRDAQGHFGASFSFGNCSALNKTMPVVTVQFCSKTNLTGTGTPRIPALFGIPTIENGFPAQQNAGGCIAGVPSRAATAPPTVTPTATPTGAPTAAAAQTTGPSNPVQTKPAGTPAANNAASGGGGPSGPSPMVIGLAAGGGAMVVGAGVAFAVVKSRRKRNPLLGL